MRIVRNQLKNKNSTLTQARQKRGLSNRIETKYDDQELRAMQRSPVKHKNTGNLFCILTEQLFWQSLLHRHD